MQRLVSSGGPRPGKFIALLTVLAAASFAPLAWSAATSTPLARADAPVQIGF